MEAFLNVFSVVLFAAILLVGTLLKLYTRAKLRDIDGISHVIVCDATAEQPPIAEF